MKFLIWTQKLLDNKLFLSGLFLLVMVWIDALYLVLTLFSFFSARAILNVLSKHSSDSGHMVVIGLGNWGFHYVKTLVSSGFSVVAIEKNPSENVVHEFIKLRLKKHVGNKLSLIEGDGFDENILSQARIGQS